ncbi:hypothetical protein C8F04DRAFT_1193256 [Mycena alexandri]|uniref:Uncharacterized protein n=1 Tax=Mycena alexandri TaxID=1745969 RepID=A0AAD6WWE1_9AGAR|nr:hypothetical protein C8F04DRAFT_1193256 [Mycena alexandri]
MSDGLAPDPARPRQTRNILLMRTRVHSALKWLCASPKSLTVSSLRALMLLEDHYDGVMLEAIEDNIISDARAAEELKSLLESTIDILESPDGVLMVQLCHSTLKEFLTHEDAPPDLGFIFSMSAAQAHCARISMSICGVSFMLLSQRSGNQLARSEIVEYAWQFWAYHFHSSGLDFGAPIMAQSFDRMVAASFEETLSFLEGVAHFLDQKFEITKIKSKHRLEFVRSFQEAQRTLAPPLEKMAHLCKSIPLAEELQRLRAEQDSKVEARRRTLEADDKQILDQVVAYVSSFRSKQSRLSLLLIDSFLPPSLLRAEGTAHNLLAEIARGLRLAAANLALDPIYKEMMDLSEGSLKPITALVQVSNFLETMAGFPYWDQCPPALDPLHAFDIEDKDPYEKHAGAVRARVNMTEKHPWDAQPLHLIVPRSLSTVQWYTALLSYRLFFSSQTSLYKTFVMNPLAQGHAQHFMYLDHRASVGGYRVKGGGWGFLADPATALMAHVPNDYKDAPFWAFLISLPALGLVLFAKYIEVLMRPVGHYAWPVLQLQWGRIKLNLTQLQTFIGFTRLIWDPTNTVSYIHCVFGMAAYLVRRRYFLWLGAHSAPHPIRDIVNCFTNPLAFWQTRTYGWWWWVEYIFWQNVGHGIMYFCATLTRTPRRGTHKAITFLPSVFVTFWALCVLERKVWTIVNATCVPLSLISFVFQDAEMVKEFVNLSLHYWFTSLLGIITWGTSILATTRLGGWGCLLMLLSTAGFLWFIVSFQDTFWDFVFTLFYPLRMGLWMALRGVVLVYLPVLKFLGIVLTLIMARQIANQCLHRFLSLDLIRCINQAPSRSLNLDMLTVHGSWLQKALRCRY